MEHWAWPNPDGFIPHQVPDDLLRSARCEIAMVELEHRLRYGQTARVEDYLAVWPDLRDNPDAVSNLIRKELTYRLFQGDDPPIDAYERRFPFAWSDDLRAELEAIRGRPENDPKVPRFRDIRLYRQGGLGRIYEAFDRELRRFVALKKVHAECDRDSLECARLAQEAEIAGRLEHPAIVSVHSLGVDNEGRPTCVMRFIRGESLRQAIDGLYRGDRRDQPHYERELRRLIGHLLVVCNAMAYAHRESVVHRDLKPDNIMLGAFGETHVVDWGLARRLGEPASTGRSSPLANSSPGMGPTIERDSAIGTEGFMSPEAAAGRPDDVDEASDIYSLGATLYNVLTGKVPPKEPFAQGATAPVDFSRPQRLRPDRRPALQAVCMKAMASAKSDRYGSAKMLADELEKWLADEPVTAWTEPVAYRLDRWFRRHRTLFVTLVASALIGSGGLLYFVAVLKATNRKLDDQRFASQRSEAGIKSALIFIQKLITAARPKDQDGGLGKDVSLRAALDTAALGLEKTFASQPAVEALIRNQIAGSYYLLGDREQARRQFERAAALLRQSGDPDQTDLLQTLDNLAHLYLDDGRYDEALSLLTETLKRRTNKLGPVDPDTLTSKNNLAAALQSAGRVRDALPIYKEALEQRQLKLGTNDPDTLLSSGNLASAFRELGQFDRALPLYKDTWKRRQALLGPNHPDTLMSANNLANFYREIGRLDDAIHLQKDTLERQQAELGPDHPDTLLSMSNLAVSYQANGQVVDALPLYQQTLDRRRATLGADNPDTLVSMSNLASAYHDAGRLADAMALFEQTLKRRTSVLGADHPQTLRSVNNLSRAYLPEKPDRAEPLLRDALAIREKNFPEDWRTFETTSLLAPVSSCKRNTLKPRNTCAEVTRG